MFLEPGKDFAAAGAAWGIIDIDHKGILSLVANSIDGHYNKSMKKKLIALDIDGTLTNGNAPLSLKTVEVLRRLNEEGHEIVLSSGRPIRAIMPYIKEIGTSSPFIAYNGLWAHRYSSFLIKKGYMFNKDIVQEIYDKAKDKLLSFMAESETNIYCSNHDDFLDMYFPYKGMNEICSLDVEIKEDVLTVLFKSEDEDVEFLKELVESHPGYGYRHWTSSKYSEMYMKGIDKGFALSLIQKALNISKEDTIAIGDSDNDYEMLLNAGHPYAMSDSKSKKLLSRFPHTKKGLSEDGAALTLEELLLKD